MGKKKVTTKDNSKAVAKAAKKAKTASKTEKKEVKKMKNNKVEDEEEDLEAILDKMQREWEEAHKVTEETVAGPPTRRANATLTACPTGNYLWLIGGEVLGEDGKAYFFNDVYRYAPDKQEWRRFTSPNCPGPRSAHAVCASPTSGGLLYLFGGEFSSPSQNSFHHYRDFWSFSVTTHIWERIETKIKPSARSGCRMTLWKHYVVLFGGFHDVGLRTSYLKDLWLFDTTTYRWQEVNFAPTVRQPSARSGFSFLPITEGVVLHGGYCKEYPTSAGGKKNKSVVSQGVGKALDDTWLLVMSTEMKSITWQKRKKVGSFPSPIRSGCTMAFWSAKGMGVMFGGVTDEDLGDEGMKSIFWNELFGYRTEGAGRWVMMGLKKPKKRTGGGKAKKASRKNATSVEDQSDWEGEGFAENDNPGPRKAKAAIPEQAIAEVDDLDDPLLTTPLTRYNAMLSILRNTLYIYGGIYERGSHEYTLDDFYSLALDKLDRYVCLRKCEIEVPTGEEDESSDDEDDDSEDEDERSSDEEDDSDEGVSEVEESSDDNDGKRMKKVGKPVKEQTEEPPPARDPEDRPNNQRQKVAAFLKSSRQSSAVTGDSAIQRSAEEALSTPLPGETLAMFYARSREYWAQRAMMQETSTIDTAPGPIRGARGKDIRRDGFSLAEERYAEYKPTLEEVEKILQEAGLDEGDMKTAAAAGGRDGGGNMTSRNRR